MLIKLKVKAFSVGANAIVVNFGPTTRNYWVAGDLFTGISAGSISTRRMEGMAIRWN
jgi:methenyltetrahydromethanopterin cyclohydrolase